MENIINYIRPEILIIIPILYSIGMGFKKWKSIFDKHIPLLLGVIGIGIAMLWIMPATNHLPIQEKLQALCAAVVQGILCVGCSVYIHQIVKQHKKEK